MYYLRSRPAADPIKFTVDVENLLINAGEIIEKEEEEEDEKVMKERTENNIGEEEVVKKKFKSNEEEQPKVCPMRRKGAPED